MLANSNNSENHELNKNSQTNNNANSTESKSPSNEQSPIHTSTKTQNQNNNDSNLTSGIFNSLANTPKLANLISENTQDNQESNMNNIDTKVEQKNEQELNKAQKQPTNNHEDSYIVLSDEENEESENNKNINDDGETNNNTFLNNKRKSPNPSESYINGKKELISKDSQNKEFQENKMQNSDESDKTKKKINDKDKLINADSQESNKIERKLYYIRKISSNRKYKFKGTDKLNIQFFIGKIMPNEFLPNFVFASEKYYYFPHKCRQVSQNYKGYIISFPGLKDALYNKIIKKDLQYLCTYYFKKPLRRRTNVEIQVKDEKTLNDGVYLNDGIVNFYLKILEDEYTCQEDKKNNVLVMQNFFYNFISNQQNNNPSNEFIIPESVSYSKTKINVFDYKTLIIPTCENYHWSLIIVNDLDKMKNIFSEENLKWFHESEKFMELDVPESLKKENSDYPEIFYLDSFYDLSQRRLLNILKYLFYEYQKIYSIDVDMNNFLVKNYDKIECYNPDVPKQKNTYDCGIFLLMYAEIFLYNPTYFLQFVSKKYKINKNKEVNNVNSSQNNLNDEPNKNTINNNLINNINNNSSNINNNNSTAKNENNLNKSDTNEKGKESPIINQNNNIQKNETKKEEAFIETDNKGNNTNNNNSDNNKEEFDIDKIDIQVEDTKLKDIEEQEKKINDESANNMYYNNGQNLFNRELNNNELDPEENPISNWFSYDLVNNQRTKIKNLINDLSKIDRKKELSVKMQEQNEIIKTFMEKQKEQFDEYFAKIKEKNA